VKSLLGSVIRLYQLALSPLLPRSCRFYPSCSEYMIQAITEFGVLPGLARGSWRLLRCNPFCAGGYDPVRRMRSAEGRASPPCGMRSEQPRPQELCCPHHLPTDG